MRASSASGQQTTSNTHHNRNVNIRPQCIIRKTGRESSAILDGAVRVIRAAHQWTRFYMRKSHDIPRALQFVELVHRHVSDNREMLWRRPQILSQRKNIDAM